MPEQRITPTNKNHLPGLDADATPVVGLGLGLTGLMLGLRPRLAPVSLALTAAAALLYRDPTRATPADTEALFAPADGVVTGLEELYEHRFLHTDAVRIVISASPFDVSVHRSPTSGTVAYIEHVPGLARPVWDLRANEQSERLYIGLNTDWGPLLVAVVAGTFARRIESQVKLGQQVAAGARLIKARFGSQVDLLLPRDIAEGLPPLGGRLCAGVTRVAHVVPL